MNAAKFEIGQRITFKFNGSTVEGRIVGVEFVDDARRGKRGWHYLCKMSDGTSVDCHQDEIGSVVGAEPSTSHMAYLSGVYDVA